MKNFKRLKISRIFVILTFSYENCYINKKKSNFLVLVLCEIFVMH